MGVEAVRGSNVVTFTSDFEFGAVKLTLEIEGRRLLCTAKFETEATTTEFVRRPCTVEYRDWSPVIVCGDTVIWHSDVVFAVEDMGFPVPPPPQSI